MAQFRFIPHKADAIRTNQVMHEGLFESLEHIADVLKSEDPELSRHLKNWTQSARSGMRVPAAVFGAYYDAVEALQATDIATASELVKRIASSECIPEKTRITVLGRDHSETDTRRIERFMGAPETGAAGVTQPDRVLATQFETKLSAAIDWIQIHVPELHDEMNALLGELILVGPAEGALEFEGGTCFRLWGAVALNAERKASVADLIVTLAHEEGHAALFGACTREMLVENPDSELYWSPIRKTERPLEGIFHASFVSARMVWVIGKMLETGDFGWLERRRLKKILKEAHAIQQDSAEIVQREGRLTETGRAVLEAMMGFMDGLGRALKPV
ncbi:aKG-HExxH-type peptide beta-hydroxylase [Hyphomonas atlantica]|uniref:HEXXH motif domain-containing protein n=1 Tax=Hyphomonas atlantica TaxID=1280948 RepID=A0A059EAB8_9PROT|nr:HEXXH motif-containing putative peptide modification protein [Hyphomonas atlantica]KCZ64457.1 hypothetical protein HY36_12740 [Hyphomonas atlantica]HAE94747.1 HEXXH motif domain-containing protein [Hyphomonas atlantica]|tara:strand:- start:205 stop:1203 length:999 start_codon:yes stop_codon:yes gene_type:complete